MQTMTSTQAKNQFGEMLDTVIREPVSITRRGRNIAYVISEKDFGEMLDGFLATKADKEGNYLSVEDTEKFLSTFQ